jgi:thymidine phosphorylase
MNAAVEGYKPSNRVRVRRLGLDTQYEAVVFMHKECQVCRSEGFTAHARVLLRNGKRQVIATLYQATGDLIAHDEAALSESAWTRLGLDEGDYITITHPGSLDSLSHVRSRIYGHDLGESSFHAIIQDIVDGRFAKPATRRSRPHQSSALLPCATAMTVLA